MALYSWFLEAHKNQSKKKPFDSRKSVDKEKQFNYVEGYTMWPTASVKPEQKIILPVNSKNSKNSNIRNKNTLSSSQKKFSLSTALTIRRTSNSV